MTKTELGLHVAAELNKLYETDPFAVGAIINTRTECSGALAGVVFSRMYSNNNPDLVSGTLGYSVGFLGLVNTLLGLEAGDRVVVIKDEVTRVVVGFKTLNECV